MSTVSIKLLQKSNTKVQKKNIHLYWLLRSSMADWLYAALPASTVMVVNIRIISSYTWDCNGKSNKTDSMSVWMVGCLVCNEQNNETLEVVAERNLLHKCVQESK